MSIPEVTEQKSYKLFHKYYIYETIYGNDKISFDIPGSNFDIAYDISLFIDFISGFHNFYLENKGSLFSVYWEELKPLVFQQIKHIEINAKSFGSFIATIFLIEIYKNLEIFPMLTRIDVFIKGGIGTNKTLALELTKQLLENVSLNDRAKNIQTNIKYEIRENDPVCIYFNPFIFSSIQNFKSKEKETLKNIVFYLQHNVYTSETLENKKSRESYISRYKNHIYNNTNTIDTEDYKVKKTYKTGLNDILSYYKKNIEERNYFEKSSFFAIIGIVRQFYGYNGFFNCLATILSQRYTSVYTGIYGEFNYSINYENIIKYFYRYRENVLSKYSLQNFNTGYKNFLLDIFTSILCVYIKFLQILSFPYYNKNIILRTFSYLCFQTFQIMQILQVFLCIFCCSLLRKQIIGLLEKRDLNYKQIKQKNSE